MHAHVRSAEQACGPEHLCMLVTHSVPFLKHKVKPNLPFLSLLVFCREGSEQTITYSKAMLHSTGLLGRCAI